MKKKSATSLLNKYLLLLLIFFGSACKEDEVLEISTPNVVDYVSVSLGEYRIYKIDSVYHDSLLLIKDTTVFYLKEIIDANIATAAENDLETFRVNRFVSANPEGPWQIRNVWAHAFNSNRLEKLENNERFIRFLGPILENTRWNENSLNTRQSQQNNFVNIEQTFVENQFSWQNTITVNQLDEFNLIRIERAKEVYAKGIGLVFKQFDTLNTYLNFNNQARPPIRTGTEFRQVLIEYGTE